MNEINPQVTRDRADQAIVVEQVLPHAPAKVWRLLTDEELMGRWMMPPTGFRPEVGTRFTFTTKPAGAWDGVIQCEVLEVVAEQRLAYAWRGGDDSNPGYGSRLDTVVTWLLTPTEGGTHVRMVHSGFEMPRNEVAYTNMSGGWRTVIERIHGALRDDA